MRYHFPSRDQHHDIWLYRIRTREAYCAARKHGVSERADVVSFHAAPSHRTCFVPHMAVTPISHTLDLDTSLVQPTTGPQNLLSWHRTIADEAPSVTSIGSPHHVDQVPTAARRRCSVFLFDDRDRPGPCDAGAGDVV